MELGPPQSQKGSLSASVQMLALLLVVDMVFTVSMDHPLPLTPRHIGDRSGAINIEVATNQIIVGNDEMKEIGVSIRISSAVPGIEIEDDGKDTISYFEERQVDQSAVTVLTPHGLGVEVVATEMLLDDDVDAAAG